jgi:hypothetical protein
MNIFHPVPMAKITPDPNKPKRKRRSFDLSTKRKLIEDLKQSNIYRTSKKSSVGRTSLLLWKKQEEKIKNAQTLFRKNVPTKPRETKGLYKDEEKEVYKWVIDNIEQCKSYNFKLHTIEYAFMLQAKYFKWHNSHRLHYILKLSTFPLTF